MAVCQKGAAVGVCITCKVATATRSAHVTGQSQAAPLPNPQCHASHRFSNKSWRPTSKEARSPQHWKRNCTFLQNSVRIESTKPGKFQAGRSHDPLNVVNSAAEGLQNIAAEQPPSSREEAVSQARTALQSVMVKFLSKQGRRKGGIASQLRLQIEVPVADETPEAQIQLAREVCDGAFSEKKGATLSLAVFVASEKVRRVAAEELQSIGGAPVASVHTLREGEVFPDSAGAVLLLGPKEEQIAHLRSIVGTAGSRPIVVLNPEWPDASEAEENNKAFVASFDVCYSFLPLNINAMLSKFEGAVLKFVRSGPPKGAPWVVFVKGDEGLKPVKTYQSRPTAKDLEDIFYNYSASQSPVNKGIGFLRGLVGKGKK